MVENKAKYYKVEEHVVGSFQLADKLATSLFAPHGTKDEKGSRTTSDVKVRVRRRAGRNGQSDSFRVVLFKRIEVKKEEKREVTLEEAPKKRRRAPRHRNDKKGRRREGDAKTSK